MIALWLAIVLRWLDPAPLTWDETRRIGIIVVCDDVYPCSVEFGVCLRCPSCCAASEDSDD